MTAEAAETARAVSSMPGRRWLASRPTTAGVMANATKSTTPTASSAATAVKDVRPSRPPVTNRGRRPCSSASTGSNAAAVSSLWKSAK